MAISPPRCATSGRREDAVSEYRRAIALDTDQAVYHALLGSLLSALAQDDAAKTEFRQALERDANLPAGLDELATSLIERASQSAAPGLANTILIDACWLLVTADHLAPGDADRSDGNAAHRREAGGPTSLPGTDRRTCA